MTPEEMKNRSRGYSTDMSPEAVEKRIGIVSDLRNTYQQLRKFKIIGPVEKKTTKATYPERQD